MASTISIVYVFRDRELDRVRRSFQSVYAQLTDNIEVVFLDYGSKIEVSKQIEELIVEFPKVDYHYVNTRGRLWSRSHALNIAIRIAKNEYVFTADIDMVFEPNFIQVLQTEANPKHATFFRVMYLPEAYTFSRFPNSRLNYVCSTDNGQGLSLFPKWALESISGFNEAFAIWGREDNEIYARLSEIGVCSSFYEPILMYHQWHGSDSVFRNPIEWFTFLTDRESFSESRNKAGWGEIPIRYEFDETIQLIEIKGRARHIQYQVLSKLLEELNTSKQLVFQYTLAECKTIQESKVFKLLKRLIKRFPKIQNQIQFLHPKYYEENTPDGVYAEFVFLTYTLEPIVKDVFLEPNADTIHLKVIV